MKETIDLDLTVASVLDETRLADIFDDLESSPISTAITKRPPEGPFAFLEWLIPTGLILLFGKPYAEEFSKTMGKKHAEAFHNAMVKLWNKVFGPKPVISWQIVSSTGKVKMSMFSTTLSIAAIRKDGGQIVLLFLKETSLDDFSFALNQFGGLLEEHYKAQPDKLTDAMRRVSYFGPNWKALVYMNPKTKQLELLDCVASSKTGQLVAFPIDQQPAKSDK